MVGQQAWPIFILSLNFYFNICKFVCGWKLLHMVIQSVLSNNMCLPPKQRNGIRALFPITYRSISRVNCNLNIHIFLVSSRQQSKSMDFFFSHRMIVCLVNFVMNWYVYRHWRRDYLQLVYFCSCITFIIKQPRKKTEFDYAWQMHTAILFDVETPVGHYQIIAISNVTVFLYIVKWC